MTKEKQAQGRDFVDKIRRLLEVTTIEGVAFPKVCTYQSIPILGTGHQSMVLDLGHGKFLSLCLIEDPKAVPL